MPASETRDTPLERYISALELVAPHADGLTAPELERALDLPKATVNRIIHVLQNSGLFAASPSRTRAFQLGPRILNILHSAGDNSWLERLTERPLQQLAESTGQSAFVVRLQGQEIRSVNCVTPDTTVRFHISPGTLLPPNASATAKAILSQHPEAFVRNVLREAATAFTPRTKMDADQVLAELAEVRSRGYAVETGEHVFGLASLGMPIFGLGGEVHFAVGLTGPEAVIMGDLLDTHLAGLRDTAERLARALSLPMA